MTVSDIGKIVSAVACTEFLACILANRFIYKSEAYAKTVSTFKRAEARRDKTAASIAAKQAARDEQLANPGKKRAQQTSQKSIEKDAKKLQLENEEVSTLAAEVARRHTMGNFYSSIAFLLLFRILSAEYSGKVVAVLPFEPFNFLKKVTFRGLGTVKGVNDLWVQSDAIPADVSSASQACAFAFIYVLCSASVKMIVNTAFGTKPPAGADQGVGNLIDAPQNKKMMKSFGLDAGDVKEARKAVGF